MSTSKIIFSPKIGPIAHNIIYAPLLSYILQCSALKRKLFFQGRAHSDIVSPASLAFSLWLKILPKPGGFPEHESKMALPCPSPV
jgi:hypothetical protein